MPKPLSLYPFLTLLLATTSLMSCSDATDSSSAPSSNVTVTWQPPTSGTVIDSLQERITEDKLNEIYFKVSVISSEASKNGSYNLKLEYGYNINETTLDLPEWPNHTILRPVLQQGREKYQCLVGFDPGDGEFRPLYEVRVIDKNIRMKQTHQYYHQLPTD